MDKKEILSIICKQVCNYLKIDNNLFFLPAQTPRVQEAKRYFCYLAITETGINPQIVSKYLGYRNHGADIVSNYNHRVRELIHKSRQMELDIEGIKKLL